MIYFAFSIYQNRKLKSFWQIDLTVKCQFFFWKIGKIGNDLCVFYVLKKKMFWIKLWLGKTMAVASFANDGISNLNFV